MRNATAPAQTYFSSIGPVLYFQNWQKILDINEVLFLAVLLGVLVLFPFWQHNTHTKNILNWIYDF